MTDVDYRSPAQKFAADLMHQICQEYRTHGELRRSTDIAHPGAPTIHTVAGKVPFTITVREGRHR